MQSSRIAAHPAKIRHTFRRFTDYGRPLISAILAATFIAGLVTIVSNRAEAAPAGQNVVVESYGSVDVSKLQPSSGGTGAWKGASRKFPDSNSLAHLKQSYKQNNGGKTPPAQTKTTTKGN